MGRGPEVTGARWPWVQSLPLLGFFGQLTFLLCTSTFLFWKKEEKNPHLLDEFIEGITLN